MLHQLSGQLSKPGEEAPAATGWTELRRLLLETELAGKYVDEIEEEVFRQLTDHELISTDRVLSVVKECIGERFLVERRSVAKPAKGPRVLALVGPTGVGKTTTVAKLAAMFALFSNKSVGLITVDTYRIAAVEQLKTYAEIINIPVEVAFTPSEVALALSRLQDKDVVIVDTAGRSQKNGLQMGELKQFLGVAAPTETHLVLSVTTKYRDLLDCLERFREVSYDHLIFTKLDETNCYGSIFNSAIEAKCPVTYLTCGQNVPDDIEEASRERLTELLLGTGAFKQ
jgi:flagellar biosynthesis protein FlhF